MKPIQILSAFVALLYREEIYLKEMQNAMYPIFDIPVFYFKT